MINKKEIVVYDINLTNLRKKYNELRLPIPKMGSVP